MHFVCHATILPDIDEMLSRCGLTRYEIACWEISFWHAVDNVFTLENESLCLLCLKITQSVV